MWKARTKAIDAEDLWDLNPQDRFVSKLFFIEHSFKTEIGNLA